MDLFFYDIVVERVIDGDTVELAAPIDGITRVRLDGLDTPETRTAACRAERNLGYEAKGYARAYLEGKTVRVITTHKRGRWGRLIARLEIGGSDYSQHMIAQGYGVKYTAAWIATPKDKRWCS